MTANSVGMENLAASINAIAPDRAPARVRPGLRGAIAGQVYALVGAGSRAIDLDEPRGDAGLFGPQSASWKVHSDFNAMMIGGMSALLVQMLHPGALGGVWDHSNWRKDQLGRLRRTAQFIAGTTYGATAQAEQLITRIRSIHDRVHGTLPDGTPYSANDPALLTWVHVVETHSFLRAYLRYRDPLFPVAEQDRYFVETAVVAAKLGAGDIPQTRRAVECYLRDIQPQLRFDARTRDVSQNLLNAPAPTLATAAFGHLVRDAAIDLLPDWAAAMHGLHVAGPRKPAIRVGALAVGSMLRWAMRDNSSTRAKARMA